MAIGFLSITNKIRDLLDAADSRLARNAWLPALLIIAAGLAVRGYYAASCYLNPDEAIHVGLAAQSSLRAAFQESFTQAHPPLLTIVLYFLMKLGASELFLRLPSLAGATLGAWFWFRWCQRVFGSGVGIGALSLMTFLPGMLLPAIEIRQYGLLVMGICGALYALEIALDRESPAWMVLAYLMLDAAILSNYSALWVAAAFSVYGLLRLYQLKAKFPNWMTWACGQANVALIYAFLYVHHIRAMRQGWMLNHAVNDYLKNGYFHGGGEALTGFFLGGLQAVFKYLTGERQIVNAGILLFAAGLVFLLLMSARPGGTRRRDLFLLLSMPLLFGFAGTMLKLQPFLGSRHVTFLFPFLAAGMALALLRWMKYPALAATLAGFAGPAWLLLTLSSPAIIPNNNPEVLSRSNMVRALEFQKAEIPRDSLILMDYQTWLEMRYYRRNLAKARACSWEWSFNRENFQDLVRKVRQDGNIQPGERIWAMSVSWYRSPPLAARALPESWTVIRAVEFGQISLVQFVVPSEDSGSDGEK